MYQACYILQAAHAYVEVHAMNTRADSLFVFDTAYAVRSAVATNGLNNNVNNNNRHRGRAGV